MDRFFSLYDLWDTLLALNLYHQSYGPLKLDLIFEELSIGVAYCSFADSRFSQGPFGCEQVYRKSRLQEERDTDRRFYGMSPNRQKGRWHGILGMESIICWFSWR